MFSDKVGSALRQAIVGRGAAYLDFDNDGDLDPGAEHLKRIREAAAQTTTETPNDMLRVKLIGTKSNRDAIGAKVTVHLASGARSQQMVKSGVELSFTK